MTEFALNLAKTVTTQILGVLGIFFVFGFALGKVQEATHKNYHRVMGWKGILWTAWIGTPIHELGHALLAKIFKHKIVSFSLFKPNQETGGLGYVNHSYNKYNLYQRMGNFLIGSAPMIFGSAFLVAMLYFLVPNAKAIFAPIANEVGLSLSFLNSLKNTFLNLFALENISTWNFWVFLYLSFCIASHMGLSKADRKGMWGGFFWIVLLIIIINTILLWIGVDITKYVLGVNQYLGIFVAVFTYTLVISSLHLLLFYLIKIIFKK